MANNRLKRQGFVEYTCSMCIHEPKMPLLPLGTTSRAPGWAFSDWRSARFSPTLCNGALAAATAAHRPGGSEGKEVAIGDHLHLLGIVES